ncbi:hypothetical protein EGW08_000968 [Elysia chlorotica]|uniref:Serine aminopeptidase S33 domain-containing protein n=1 Tax=Elysia chlorotica TaxID=188477 RepID=A0A3S1BTJ0_ELYCH|nr:hypothetical protein EGW08_000968 [Elysia chlorotica]
MYWGGENFDYSNILMTLNTMGGKDNSNVMKTFTYDSNSGASDGYFVNENGFTIYCKYWSTAITSPRALVFMCHGAAEHTGPYTQLAELLTAQNFFVFGHDHQGHGRSEGDRVHIENFRHYSRDVFAHIDRIKLDHPSLPGGAIAILSALDRPDYYKGLVLIGPVVTADQDLVGPCQEFFGKLISYIVPQFPVFKLDANAVSRDTKVVKEYIEDPLNYHGYFKAEWAMCLNNTMKEIESKLATIEWPFLTIHGDLDALVKPIASEKLYAQCASTDKTMTIYPGGYHQLHRDIEPDGSTARQQIIDWLVSHEQ